jgi:hypothetical protein
MMEQKELSETVEREIYASAAATQELQLEGLADLDAALLDASQISSQPPYVRHGKSPYELKQDT